MRTLNRGIAARLVPVLARTPLTPNQVTLLGLGAGLCAGWQFARGADGWIPGALWLQLSFVLDNCDGELARWHGRQSGLGSWLDTISDCAVNAIFFFALGAGLARDLATAFWWGVGLLTAVGVLFSYAASFAVEVRHRGGAAWRHPDPPKEAKPTALVAWRKRAREDFSWIVLVAAFAGHMAWLLWCGLASSFAIGCVALRALAAPAARPAGAAPETATAPDEIRVSA